jgi:hypothetical protein
MPKITIEKIGGRVTVTIEPGARKPPAPLGMTRGEQCERCGVCYVVGTTHECAPRRDPDTLN